MPPGAGVVLPNKDVVEDDEVLPKRLGVEDAGAPKMLGAGDADAVPNKEVDEVVVLLPKSDGVEGAGVVLPKGAGAGEVLPKDGVAAAPGAGVMLCTVFCPHVTMIEYKLLVHYYGT